MRASLVAKWEKLLGLCCRLITISLFFTFLERGRERYSCHQHRRLLHSFALAWLASFSSFSQSNSLFRVGCEAPDEYDLETYPMKISDSQAYFSNRNCKSLCCSLTFLFFSVVLCLVFTAESHLTYSFAVTVCNFTFRTMFCTLPPYKPSQPGAVRIFALGPSAVCNTKTSLSG